MLVLGALIALGPLTIDMYLPALPTITAQLLTTSATVQLTLTGTLLGIAVGQLVVGPLSDRFGRKRPLLMGTALHVLASALCVVAPNIALLGGLRVLQGVGAAAGSVIAMAIVRDLYTGRAAATLLSRLILVMGAAPVIAPTLGGWILQFVSWRGVFAVLAVYGLVLVPIAVRLLPETLPPERRRTDVGVGGTLRTYGSLLRDRQFVGLVLVAGLAMSAMMSYISGSSFVFQEQFGLDEQTFGLVFGSGAIWLIAATQLNPVLLKRFEPGQVLTVAAAAAAGAGALFLVLAVTGAGLVGIVGAVWLVLACVGLVMPNAPAVALSRHGEAAGTAAALLGAAQFGTGALVSPLVGVLGNDAVAMAASVAAGLGLALLVVLTLARPWRIADPA